MRGHHKRVKFHLMAKETETKLNVHQCRHQGLHLDHHLALKPMIDNYHQSLKEMKRPWLRTRRWMTQNPDQNQARHLRDQEHHRDRELQLPQHLQHWILQRRHYTNQLLKVKTS